MVATADSERKNGGIMNKKFALATLAITALGFSHPANATVWCSGTISASWVNDGGAVLILGSWRGDHTQICNIKVEWRGITPDVCAAWMAKVDAAVALGRAVTLLYPNESGCGSLPTYSDTPAPSYVMLN